MQSQSQLQRHISPIRRTYGVKPDKLDGKAYSLRDLFAVIPEMAADFSLLQSGPASVVTVRVTALIGGPTKLRYYIPGEKGQGFADNWSAMFPWMVDVCEYNDPFTLRLKVERLSDGLVEEFCRMYLIHNLRFLNDALWFDHKVGDGVTLLPRLNAYIAAMFVLSNISRYEPEFLDDATLQLTDLGFFIRTFLENA